MQTDRPKISLADKGKLPEPGLTTEKSTLNWRQELARAFRSISDLLIELDLDPSQVKVPEKILGQFPLRVPRGFVSRMQKGNPNDPLLRQVLPVGDEAITVAGYGNDPVGDLASMRGHGILQKYDGRALLLVTGACAVHCRYCFRRNFPYPQATLANGQIAEALGTIHDDTSVEEVILSGGDPLSISDQRLNGILTALGQISHLKRIRIHTRLPIVLPERVDSSLLEVLALSLKPLIWVLHVNHANEIDAKVSEAVSKLSTCAVAVFNQSVLLRGINDSVTALTNLSERLFEIGVIPYYLHQLDAVGGAAHFEVDDQHARHLMGEVAAKLPGYLLPRLVREIPGAPAKVLMPPLLHNTEPSNKSDSDHIIHLHPR